METKRYDFKIPAHIHKRVLEVAKARAHAMGENPDNASFYPIVTECIVLGLDAISDKYKTNWISLNFDKRFDDHETRLAEVESAIKTLMNWVADMSTQPPPETPISLGPVINRIEIPNEERDATKLDVIEFEVVGERPIKSQAEILRLWARPKARSMLSKLAKIGDNQKFLEYQIKNDVEPYFVVQDEGFVQVKITN